MNVYVLKGVLLDACKTSASTSLKCRLFGAISFPGFVNSTYDVIGVEFGLGIMELDESITGEPATAKIQAWNLNENDHFAMNWKHFSRGSRFVIIAWEHASDTNGHKLRDVVREITSACPAITIGIVATVDEPGINEHIVDMLVMPKSHANSPRTRASSLDVLLARLVNGAITQDRSIHVLPVASPADIEPATCILNPFNNYTSAASRTLRDMLESNYTIDTGRVVFEHGKHVFKINLDNSSMRVGLVACNACKDAGCGRRDQDTRICVVLDSCQQRGWASPGSSLSDCDLFILSMIYSITSDAGLPASITSQFPACPKKKG